MELYDELKVAGVAMDHHESDLYCEDTHLSRSILVGHPMERNDSSPFINQAPPWVGMTWLDIPFAFAPYWRACRAGGNR